MWQDNDANRKVGRVMDLFLFYNKIGFMRYDLKTKWGNIVWSVNLNSIKSLHDVIKNGHHFYRWDCTKHPVLHTLDIFSRYFFGLAVVCHMTRAYKILIYNIAYTHACLVCWNNKEAYRNVMYSCDWPECFFFHKWFDKRFKDKDEEIN